MPNDSPETTTERRSRTDRRSPRPAPFTGTERRVGPRRASADRPPMT